jgi:hypothetical protein
MAEDERPAGRPVALSAVAPLPKLPKPPGLPRERIESSRLDGADGGGAESEGRELKEPNEELPREGGRLALRSREGVLRCEEKPLLKEDEDCLDGRESAIVLPARGSSRARIRAN